MNIRTSCALPDQEISIEPTRVYRAEDARELLQQLGNVDESVLQSVDGNFYAGFVRARKLGGVR
jgi:arsenite methyltransferase